LHSTGAHGIQRVTPIVTLRPAGPEDEAFLFEVYAGGRTQEMLLVPWTDEEKQNFLRFQFQAQQKHYQNEFPNAQHHIILSNGKRVGRLYVDRRKSEIRILDVTMLPAERGKGVGTKLMRDLLAEALAASKLVTIYVDSDQRAVGLFQRLGFVKKEDGGVVFLMQWSPDR
jgi:ribosomal protein S18 acetylase RimI-like enzyme